MLKRVFIITLPTAHTSFPVWTATDERCAQTMADHYTRALERLQLDPENECPSSPH